MSSLREVNSGQIPIVTFIIANFGQPMYWKGVAGSALDVDTYPVHCKDSRPTEQPSANTQCDFVG